MIHNAKIIKKPDIKSATSLFHDIVVNNKLEKTKYNEKLDILDMSQKGVWLEPWMIKSEEISIMLVGKRIFNVLYKEDKESLLGVIAQDFNDIEEFKQNEKNEDYNEIIDETPLSIKYVIGELAFNKIIKIENNNATLTLDGGISLIDSDIDGYYKPMSKDDITRLFLKKYLDKTKTAMFNIRNDKELIEKIKKRNAPTNIQQNI